MKKSSSLPASIKMIIIAVEKTTQLIKKPSLHTILIAALWKALLATLLFLIFYQFYNIEIVRDKVEDIAFDTINKFYIHNQELNVTSPSVMLFAFDDLYMKQNGLFDEDNRSNYGYLFPRDRIAAFIESLDELMGELDEGSEPEALFVDYDISFTGMPYGQALSDADQKLIDVLKKPRPYTTCQDRKKQLHRE